MSENSDKKFIESGDGMMGVNRKRQKLVHKESRRSEMGVSVGAYFLSREGLSEKKGADEKVVQNRLMETRKSLQRVPSEATATLDDDSVLSDLLFQDPLITEQNPVVGNDFSLAPTTEATIEKLNNFFDSDPFFKDE